MVNQGRSTQYTLLSKVMKKFHSCMPEIKTAIIKRKHQVYNKYVSRGRRLDEWDNVRVIWNDSSKIITTAIFLLLCVANFQTQVSVLESIGLHLSYTVKKG